MEQRGKRKWACRRCGYPHRQGHCPAFGKRCSKCHGFNHFAKMCWTKREKKIGNNDNQSIVTTSSCEDNYTEFSDNESIISASSCQNNRDDYGKDITCSECGFKHSNAQCAAYGQQCSSCNQFNHFSQVCPRLKANLPGANTVHFNQKVIQSASGAVPKNYNKCSIFCTYVHDYIFIIASCGHSLYRNCLSKAILDSEDDLMTCPATETCDYILSQSDIKQVLTAAEYEIYISNEKSFRCRTEGCSGWCIYRKQPRFFQCSTCTKINCLLCKNIHETGPCKEYEDILNYPNENNTEVLKKNPDFFKSKIYSELLDLNGIQLVLCPNKFQCLICFEDFGPMEGISMKECLHVFCRSCLQNTIKFSETSEVKCPYLDNNYSCESYLLEYEIRNILSTEDYEQRLKKTLNTAKMQLTHIFHCKTPNCDGWCEIEDDAEVFICFICFKPNCIICSVIHENMTCEEHQQSLFEEMTENQIQNMIRRGDAMRCPKCTALISKTEGCDGVICVRCKLDICWVTKRPRWGPKGKGDDSGGCRCKVNGRLCHPQCQNCH